MKEILKTLGSWCLQCVYRVFWLFPIKKDAVFFSAYSGNQYACNPKYISEELADRYAGRFRLIWCRKEGRSFPENYPDITFVKFRSLAYYKALLTSRVVVFNDLQHCSYLPFRRSQTLIQTWHGGGLYKKVGRDLPENTLWHDRRLARTIRKTSLFLSSSRAFSETVIRGAFGYNGKIAEIGLPRNDLLLNTDLSNAAADKVRRRLDLPKDQRLLLFAPTFRGLGEGCAENFDIEHVLAACRDRFGGEWKLLVRSHYLLAATGWNADPRCIDVTDYPDMQELLAAAAVLISDYSSCIWDFSLTGKPCFLFTPDLDDYRIDRNFYLDITKWPFPQGKTDAALCEAIRSLDAENYAENVARHLHDLGCRESGRSAQAIADFIASL